METIGQFSVIRQLREFNENLNLWRIESNDGQEFDVLTIQQNQDYQNLLNRLLGNEILPLVNHKIEGIQKTIEVGFDTLSRSHFIVYESSDGFEINFHSSLNGLKSVIIGLNELKKQNRFGYLISTETLLTKNTEVLLSFSGLFELFKHQNLLQAEFLAPEVIEGSRPNFQSDIYSVFKCFESLLNEDSDEILKEVFTKALSGNRTDRFTKYSEIITELEKVYSPTGLSKWTKIRVVVKQEDSKAFLPMLKEMNDSCYFLLERSLSKEKGQVTGQFSTTNFSGRFFVDQEGYLFIPFQGVRSQTNPKVIEQGFTTAYGYDFNPMLYFNCTRYFIEQWEELNTLAELNKTKHSLLKKWQTLPDQERTFIEEKAFKAAFIEREESKSNSVNIRFKLTNDFRNWEIFKELKHNNIDLFIDDKIIGKVQDYNPSDCFLVIKDAQVTIDEIPEKGELHQDVRVETSQFKKQVEACKKFEAQNVVNPDLCEILATPENVPVPKRVDIDYEGFRDEVVNPYLKTDDTQRDAVLEALHYKPVYLIQGPPGTGKTTVIVELIQQIVKQNSHAKILVTSQSNLAVDNVL